MNKAVRAAVTLTAALLFGAGTSRAQMFPERRDVRAGNRNYEELDFAAAEKNYRSALEKAPGSFEAGFNLGDALFKQGRYEEAADAFRQLTQREGLPDARRAAAWYNLGNTLFQTQKFQEALEAYKSALKLNPDDLQAKYNYAYTKKLLEQNRQNQQDRQNDPNGQEDRKPQDGPDEDRRNDNSGQNDPNDSDDRDERGGDDSRKEDSDGGKDGSQQQKPQPTAETETSISRREAEQLLDAVQNQEDKTRQKIDAAKVVAGSRSGKDW